MTIPTHAVLGPLYDSWEDLDRALLGLSAEDALRSDHGSAIAWTVGHCANQVDTLINVRLAGAEGHPLVSQQRFRVGGEGVAEEWESILSATAEVREAARRFLDGLDAEGLIRRVPYPGSLTFLRERGTDAAYTASRIATHHYFHAGEIAVIRSLMGQWAGDYPGPMRWSLGQP